MSPILAQAAQLSLAALFVLRLVLAITVVWLGVTVLALLLDRASAALRHRLWAMSMLAAIALPALLAGLPQWHVGMAKVSTLSNPVPVVAKAPIASHDNVASPLVFPAARELQPPEAIDASTSPPQSAQQLAVAAHAAPKPVPAGSSPAQRLNWPFVIASVWLVIA